MPLVPILVVGGILAILIFGTKIKGGSISVAPPSAKPLGSSQTYQDMMMPGSSSTNGNLRVGDIWVVSMGLGPPSDHGATSVSVTGDPILALVGPGSGPTVTWRVVKAGTAHVAAHFAGKPDGLAVLTVAS